MDAGGSINDLQYPTVESLGHLMERPGNVDPRSGNDGGWRLVDVVLSGGAPWGFTLRGGREHREPLLITKVEEGSKAAAVSLQVGDELVNINEIPLSGYRQEAICLVKGSHKILALVVKRRNEPVSRPHSWHSTKFNENQSETAKTQSPPTPVWQSRYDASSSSTDLSTGWEQTNLRRVSDQFSSLGSMDSLEHVPHPYPPGQLSPAKSNNSVDRLGVGKRDSAYSSFSTSSGTPDYTLSKSNAASTENMLYKVSQWDSGNKNSNVRNSQSLSDGVKQDERSGYLQIAEGSTGRDSPRTEEQAGSRHSSSSRASLGPVWHVPEKKRTTSHSPPPPPPPVRSDSFAATKVHEKGLIIAYPEGPDTHVYSKPYEKGPDKGSEVSDNAKRITERRNNYNPPTINDNAYISSDDYNYNQLNSNKLCSVSSTDVRQGPPPPAYQPYHQRQYSSESTFYSQTRATSQPKPQSVGGYYSSMQELPTNSSAQVHSQTQERAPSASLSTTAIDQNPDNSGPNRYYCVTSSNPMLSKVDDRKSSGSIGVVQTGNEKKSLSPQNVSKAKFQLPQPQHHYSKENNGYSKQEESLHHKQPPTVTSAASLEAPVAKPCSDERGGQRRHNSQSAEPHYTSHSTHKQAEQRRSLPLQHRDPPQELQHQGYERNKICPQATPMLHSLSKETMCKDEKLRATSFDESLDAKQVKRSDRFATTLRNEIQMRRAKLQKSKSAAALTGAEADAEEEQEVWKSKERSPPSNPSSADSSFTSTYKDNLKEAQAWVLKATSFRRRDLEPVLLEHPGGEALPNYSSSVMARKEVSPLPTVSESEISKSGSVTNQVTRIGGRKRFSTEKKVKSFSEPNKIHEVGMNEDSPVPESSAEQHKFFEATSRPAFSKPVPKQPIQGYSEPKENRVKALASTKDTEDRSKFTSQAEYSVEGQGYPQGTHKQAHTEQQRLGTFAEYEASWNAQKKASEAKASGRYRSADNILDPGVETQIKPTCVHERSRSSPSADLYGQKIPVLGRKSEEYSPPENKAAERDSTTPRFSDRGHGDCGAREKPVEVEHFPGPMPVPTTRSNPESRHSTTPATVYQAATSISPCPIDAPLPPSEDHSHTEQPSGPRRKAPLPQRAPPPKLDNSRLPEITPSLSDFQESRTGSQGGTSSPGSTHRDINPAPIPSHSPKRSSEQSKGPRERGQGSVHQGAAASPLPLSPPLAPSCEPSALGTMDGQRSPSPQFAPQKLSDKPPVSLQDANYNRMDNVTEDSNTAVKKVPIKIVHSESISEKENRQYLLQNGSSTAEAQGPAVTWVSSLGTPEQDYSVFCAYTRQKEPSPGREPAAQAEPAGIPDIGSSVDQQTCHPAEEQSSNRGGLNAVLAEEDHKREELARDIMGKDRSLADILDQSNRKTTMDLMEGIFPQGEQLLEGAHQRRKVAPKQASARPADERKEDDGLAAAVAVVTSSTYYSTSAPKAELLIKMKDMQEQDQTEEEEEEEEELDIDLANKKQELINSLSKKLQVLREARESLQEDVLDNNALGEDVEATVRQVCKPNELDKFRMFVGDLDKVVSLLLSLSGRLARVENALNSLEEDASAEERRTLTEKRKLLIRQHEDAKELKENLDRRERVVYDILASYLTEESLADYEHFVKMKSALIIEQRKLEDKIKLGEEQLKCLTDSLPLEQRGCCEIAGL